MNFMRYARLLLVLFLALYGQSAMGMTDNIEELDSLISFATNNQMQNLPQEEIAEDQVYQSEHTKRLEAEQKRLEQIEAMGDHETIRQQEIQKINDILTFAKTDPKTFDQLVTEPFHQLIAQQQLTNVARQAAQPLALPQPMNITNQVAQSHAQPHVTRQIEQQPVVAIKEEKKEEDKMTCTSCVTCWAKIDLPYADLLRLQEQGFTIACEKCTKPASRKQKAPSSDTSDNKKPSKPVESGAKSRIAQDKPRNKGKFVSLALASDHDAQETKKPATKAINIICQQKRCGVRFMVSPDTLKITLEALAHEQPPRTKDQIKCSDFGYECSLYLKCKACGSRFSIPKKYQPEFLTHQERENFTCAFITWEKMSDIEQSQQDRCPLMQESKKPVQKKKKTKKS